MFLRDIPCRLCLFTRPTCWLSLTPTVMECRDEFYNALGQNWLRVCDVGPRKFAPADFWMIPTLILAAGASSRMRGSDKLLEPVDGLPLLRLQIDRAAALGGLVYVALSKNSGPRFDIVTAAGAIPLIVPEAAEGIGGSLRGAVCRLPPCDAFMLMLADLPDIQTTDLQAVVAAYETQPACLIWRGATPDSRAGHPIIFSATLRPLFEDLEGDTGAGPIIKTLSGKTCLVPFADDRARLDLDTPEDWTAWRCQFFDR